jgi:recombination protein RecR
LFAAPVNRLITELARLPGIGQRTAQRLAFHILSASDEEALALADAIREVKATVGQCEVCFNLATEANCRICQDERREAATICVVEQPSDVIPIERSGEFHGRYHVLGGALSPIDGVDPEDLHIAELLGRVETGARADNGAGVREVVIATNATTTGEATAMYLADALRERAPDLVVTRLASGLPVGSDLEYADEITLGRALRGRQAI